MEGNELFQETEQSRVYKSPRGTLIKSFKSQKDYQNELRAYQFLGETHLLKIPRLYEIGKDFLEIECLNKVRESSIGETIEALSPLYTAPIQEGIFSELDLSKDKLLHRIGYLAEEVVRRNISPRILSYAERFVNERYLETVERTSVHGDLKPVHIIPTSEELKFIDFALFGVANPWYDLAFLFMAEPKDKQRVFDEISEKSGGFSKVDLKTRRNFLQSSIFNRLLYNFGYALRHRPDKSLDRVVGELNQIINLR